jgi:hypothetical protein
LGDTLPIDRQVILDLAGLLDNYNNGLGDFNWDLPLPAGATASGRTVVPKK